MQAEAQRQIATARLDAQRQVVAAEARAAAAEATAAEASARLNLAQTRLTALEAMQRSSAAQHEERESVVKQTESSRAEAAEAQLRALKEELGGLQRAHQFEVSALRSAHQDEVASLKRAHAAELTALDRSGTHSKQISGLAAQVGSAHTRTCLACKCSPRRPIFPSLTYRWARRWTRCRACS